MTDVRKLPLATKEQATKYMDEAVQFVQHSTGIAEDTMKVLLEKMPNPIMAIAVGELVVYMAVFSAAERAAQADGVTLRDWAMAESAGAPSATANVAGPSTLQ